MDRPYPRSQPFPFVEDDYADCPMLVPAIRRPPFIDDRSPPQASYPESPVPASASVSTLDDHGPAPHPRIEQLRGETAVTSPSVPLSITHPTVSSAFGDVRSRPPSPLSLSPTQSPDPSRPVLYHDSKRELPSRRGSVSKKQFDPFNPPEPDVVINPLTGEMDESHYVSPTRTKSLKRPLLWTQQHLAASHGEDIETALPMFKRSRRASVAGRIETQPRPQPRRVSGLNKKPLLFRSPEQHSAPTFDPFNPPESKMHIDPFTGQSCAVEPSALFDPFNPPAQEVQIDPWTGLPFELDLVPVLAAAVPLPPLEKPPALTKAVVVMAQSSTPKRRASTHGRAPRQYRQESEEHLTATRPWQLERRLSEPGDHYHDAHPTANHHPASFTPPTSRHASSTMLPTLASLKMYGDGNAVAGAMSRVPSGNGKLTRVSSGAGVVVSMSRVPSLSTPRSRLPAAMLPEIDAVPMDTSPDKVYLVAGSC